MNGQHWIKSHMAVAKVLDSVRAGAIELDGLLCARPRPSHTAKGAKEALVTDKTCATGASGSGHRFICETGAAGKLIWACFGQYKSA